MAICLETSQGRRFLWVESGDGGRVLLSGGGVVVEKLSRGPEAHRSRCNLVAAGAGGNTFNAGSVYRGKQVNDRLSIPASLVDPTSDRRLADSGLGCQTERSI